MFTDARAAAPLLVAAGTLAGTLGAALPLAAGLPGPAAALLAALVAAGTTGVALTRLRPARDPAEAVPTDARLDGFETAPSALLLIGPEGRIRHANAAFHALLNHHGAQLRRRLDHPAADRIIGTDVRLLLPDYDACRSGPWQGRLTLGDQCLGLRLAPLADGQGSVLALADLTAHQRLQTQIAAIERHQMLIELAPDGRILCASDRAARATGMEPAVLTGRTLDSLLADAGSSFAPALSQAAETGFARARLALSNRGGTIWLDAALYALRDDEGRLDRLLLVASDATDSVTGLQREEAQRLESQETLAMMARHLGDGLTALARGDLTHRILTAFPPSYEPLRQNYNSALDRLAEALVEVLSVTGTIRNRAAELNAAAEDLSRRTEGQAATLEETAAALDELTASVRSAAENAASADQSARAAHREAEESGRVVTDAVNAMGQIESSSRQISQIIGVIDEIAFQTNLLALNAGVEAARAGDAGRGFAVVASEVRALAQRSSEAAREIKDLISASSRQVENGVTLVGQAGDTLRAIVAGVTNIAEQVSALAQSSREQATGITEINSGVTMLDQVTQQNAAMVEESTAASHSLHRAAESLAALMHRFRLDGVVPAKAEPPSRDSNITHLRLAEPAREPRQPARAAAQAGWEEF